MSRFLPALASVLLILGGFAANVDAQARSLLFGVSGGPTFPVGEVADEFDLGLHIHGLAQTGPLGALPLALRGELGYQRFSHDDDFLRHLVGRANAVIPFLGQAGAAPYLIAGVGVYNMEESIEHGDHFDEDSGTFFGLNGGVGVRWTVGGLPLLVEARFHHVFTEGHEQQFVPLSIGVLF